MSPNWERRNQASLIRRTGSAIGPVHAAATAMDQLTANITSRDDAAEMVRQVVASNNR